MKRKVVTITAFTVIVCLFLFCITLYLLEDKEAPVIEILDDSVVYQGDQNAGVLLTGVKAIDKQEGDVTASLVIESIHELATGDKVSVIYAARDSKNNVVKKERILEYVKVDVVGANVLTEEEQDGLSSNINSEVTNEENNNTNLETQGETSLDGVTGDLESEQDTEETEADVIDNEDINQDDNTPLVSTGDPLIKLNTYEVTIAAGGYFNPMNYIEDAVDDVDDAWRRIRIVGEYHTSTPGEYTLEYYVVDSDGNQSNVETLRLVVE
jgi:hypothetical protein